MDFFFIFFFKNHQTVDFSDWILVSSVSKKKKRNKDVFADGGRLILDLLLPSLSNTCKLHDGACIKV